MGPSQKAVAAARLILRADKDARKADRQPRVIHQRAKPKGGHVADHGFMSWQHESGLPCICCEIEGRPSAATLQGESNRMEVAHQRVTGWKKGVKADDRHSCPLCRWHHQLAPNACDKGQRQFWDRLGVDAGDYTDALHRAYRGGSDGLAVVRRFAATRVIA